VNEAGGAQQPAPSARAELARELRRLRKAAELTQAALAERLGYVREYVTLAEREHSRELPSESFVWRCGQVLGATTQLLDLHRQAVAERTAGRQELVLPSSAVGPSAQLTPPDFATSLQVMGLWQFTRGHRSGHDHAQGLDMRRRQFLAELAAALGVVTVRGPSLDPLGAEPWERLALALREPSTLDPAGLARLEAEIVGCWREYTMAPSGRLLGRALWRLQDVTQLLSRSPKDALLPQLYSLAGQTAGLAGWLSFDVHDHVSAEQYYRVALDAARRLKDHWLEAYLLGLMSFLPMLTGDVRQALEMLGRAHRLAGSGSSLVVRSWIAAVLAEAHSLAGNDRGCLTMLDEAENCVREAAADDPAADVFDTARLAGFKGACLVRLARPDEAHPILELALDSLRPELVRQRSNVLTDDALALLQLGALEESCQAALRSVKVVATIRPAVGSQRMRQLRGRYEPWRDHPAVKALDEQLWSI
jgi:transcriptional regulator with XRE-family HTH domain